MASRSPRPPLSAQISQALRQYFVTGLATIFPVAVTLWVVLGIFRAADGLLGRHLESQIPGLGILLTLLIILAVGVFSVHFFGRVIVRAIEAWVIRIPFVRRIYPVAKQLAQFLFPEPGQAPSFRRVVLARYPHPGTWALAFVTNEWESDVIGPRERMLTLLVPQPPNPLTGPVLFVPDRDVITLEISVEDAVKLVVSAGIVAQPLRAAGSKRPPAGSG